MWSSIKRQKYAHMFVLTGMLIVFIFQYMPMFGILMAFKQYSITTGIKGIFTSQWVGFKYFVEFFNAYNFEQIVKNTIGISLLKLVFTFPVPILLAIMLNEVKSRFFKRFVQTVSYFPHFISWIVVSGLLVIFFSTNSGIVNDALLSLGIIKEPIALLSNPDYFWGLAVGSAMWKEAGWWAIIFLAAISGLDPSLYEAAEIDGAGRLRRIWHITLPGIRGTIVVVLILAVGSLLGGGLVGSNFEQSYLLGNVMNNEKSEILQTYAFKMGLAQGRYAFATAIDLLQSIIAIILVFSSNYISKKATKSGLF
ncbi:ABC transporter permease [Cohnella cholangitidis]|uniref:Sugar ABC transporter permease n=1 Tax=Cohnella cholangitidis TaxID=2598458 RepID=A0A7G5C0W8_9BACL|nr:ABC transporter permease subunit [Cohnella cholangitidis]QMV42852.1 sugar ABC transporter permease [Cohnella cholangitidis]